MLNDATRAAIQRVRKELDAVEKAKTQAELQDSCARIAGDLSKLLHELLVVRKNGKRD